MRTFVAIIVAIALTPSAFAQGPANSESDEAGAEQTESGAKVRVRVSGESDRIVGRLVSIDNGDLTIVTEENARVELQRDTIEAVEVQNGRKRHWLAGLAIGVALGATIGALEGETCNEDGECQSRGQNMTNGAIGAGVVGLAVGAFIKSDRWLNVPLGSLRVRVAAGRARTAVSVALRF